MKIVLASASPRRIEILRAAGLRFAVVPSGIDERPPRRLGALRYIQWAARAKAEAVAAGDPMAVVIAADTEVVLRGRIFGKPRDRREAAGFLRALSGRTHQVYTAVCVLRSGHYAEGVSRTHVTMRELSAAAIAAYMRTGEAQDKAGAYAIQGKGRRLIASIRGPYDNVVGMPLHLLRRLLWESGVAITLTSPDELQHDVIAPPRRRSRPPTRGTPRR
ncbi:MAG TPA: Maf family protein [Candidatus Dormibacteraeota bacterium]